MKETCFRGRLDLANKTNEPLVGVFEMRKYLFELCSIVNKNFSLHMFYSIIMLGAMPKDNLLWLVPLVILIILFLAKLLLILKR